MPPKPLAEDLARKKAERDKQAKTQEAFAALENPNGLTQFVNAVKDPVGTVKQLGRVAKETFYDPSKRFAAAVDPNSGASVADRIAGVGEGVLYAMDALTPGVPEGIMAKRLAKKLAKEAPEATIEYGIHHSLTPGITNIRPSRANGQVTAMDARPGSTYFWATDPKDAMPTIGEAMGQLERATWRHGDWMAESPEFYRSATPRMYVTRVPKRGVMPDENVPGSLARRIEQPLRAVREIDPFQGYDAVMEQFRRAGVRAPRYTRAQYDASMTKLAAAKAQLENMARMAAD